jgi:hypothetical protein
VMNRAPGRSQAAPVLGRDGSAGGRGGPGLPGRVGTMAQHRAPAVTWLGRAARRPVGFQNLVMVADLQRRG